MNDRVLDVSLHFMVEDLLKSGLTPADCPIEPTALSPIKGRGAYRIRYDDTFYKDRFDRDENRYINKAGSHPPVIVFGIPETSPCIFIVEGYKKALLLYLTTGFATLVLDSCWGFGDGEHELAQEVLAATDPRKPHLV